MVIETPELCGGRGISVRDANFIFWCYKEILQTDDSTFKQWTAKSLCYFLVSKTTSNAKCELIFSLSAQKSKQRKRVTGYVQLDFPNMLSSMRVSRFFSSLCRTESALGPCQESLQSASSAFDWVTAMAGCFTKLQLLESYHCLKKSKTLALIAVGRKKKKRWDIVCVNLKGYQKQVQKSPNTLDFFFLEKKTQLPELCLK